MNKIKESILGNNYIEFINTIFTNIPTRGHHHDTLRHALSNADKDGCYLEFGTYTGTTIRIIADYIDKVYGFDSFEGLPEDWNFENLKGSFNLNGIVPDLNNPKVELIKGLFQDSLPDFISKKNLDFISFIHLDADLYSSTKFVLQELSSFFKKKCVFVFDEFCNLPEGENHEYKAFSEFLYDMEDRIESFEYLGRSSASHYSNFSIILNFK